MSITTNNLLTKFLLWLHPIQRIMISIIIAAIAYLFIRNNHLSGLMRYMILWDVFGLTFLLTNWAVLFTRTTNQIREFARNEDGSLGYVFSVVILAAFSSMFTVMLLLIGKDVSGVPKYVYAPIAVLGIVLSWAIVHTTFCFHYALLYYDDDNDNPKEHAGGLSFPDEDKPDYLDFAYFSFIIGMTFQVSDVETTSRTLRRWVLLHSLLSFGLNTFIVALTINLIAGLKG